MKAIPCPIPASELDDIYTRQKLTDEEIVTHLGAGSTLKRVRSWRKRFDIKTIPRWSRNDVPPIEGKLRSLLIGSMLGDGRLVRQTNATHYSECHTASQEAYLRWKGAQWGTWIKPEAVKPSLWLTGGKEYNGFRFNTVAHADLNSWQELFYADHKRGWKHLLPQVVDLMDEFALAIWYLDDGTASSWWPDIAFGADAASRKVAMTIFEKFGLSPRWKQMTGKTGVFHMEREDTAHRFLELVTPHIPECMASKASGFGFQGPQYKVRQRLSPELLLDGVQREVPLRTMARDLGVSVTAVKSALERHGIDYNPSAGRPSRKITWLAEPMAPLNQAPLAAADDVARIKDLLSGGLTTTQVAELLGVSQSTILRRAREAGIKLKTGPKAGLSISASTNLLSSKYPDTGVWSDLTPDKQGEWVSDIFLVLQRTPFPFPVTLTESRVRTEFQSVQRSRAGITSWSPGGLRLCNSLFPNRYKATYKSKSSAWEGWHNEKQLRAAIKFQLRVGDPVAPKRVMRAMTANCRTPTVFKPIIAKYLYETFCPPGGVVWDPCSGYGGRLLGALAAGVRYIASEVEAETVEGNLRLAELVGMSDQVEVHEARAEEFDPGPVDMVFTSPPYFDLELYGKARGQSSLQNPTFDGWIESFLKPVVQRAWDRLPESGVLVLNVTDVKKGRKVYPLVDRTIEVALDAGFQHEDTLRMPLANLNRKNASEPLLVFRR